MEQIQAQPAVMQGTAERIPAAIKAAEAVLHATITITRAGTGKVEHYTITGTAEQPKEAE